MHKQRHIEDLNINFSNTVILGILLIEAITFADSEIQIIV